MTVIPPGAPNTPLASGHLTAHQLLASDVTALMAVAQRGYQAFTTPGNTVWTIPQGITRLRIRAQGGGGGGGGGGSSQVTTPVAQTGGGGGAAGTILDLEVILNPTDTTLLINLPTVALGGAGGVAGSGATGNGGGNGQAGGAATVTGQQSSMNYVTAAGGGAGGPSGASTTGLALCSLYGTPSGFQVAGGFVQLPGSSGSGQRTSGSLPNGSCGGSGGGAASATTPFNGGGAGQAGVWPISSTGLAQGAAGGSGTTAGIAGATATYAGSGGGGGGGGGAGGAGGAGGNGGPGIVEIWW